MLNPQKIKGHAAMTLATLVPHYSAGGGAEGAGAVSIGTGVSRIEDGRSSLVAIMANRRLVTKKHAANIAVARVKRFAVPRADISPPMFPPPIPNPPPSLRWIKITTIMLIVKSRCIANMVVCMFLTQLMT